MGMVEGGSNLWCTNPRNREKIYCSVMGQVGGLKATGDLPGENGVEKLCGTRPLETDTDPNEMIMRQRCIMVSFVPANAAEEDDLALLKHIGIALDANAGSANHAFLSAGLRTATA